MKVTKSLLIANTCVYPCLDSCPFKNFCLDASLPVKPCHSIDCQLKMIMDKFDKGSGNYVFIFI